MCWNWHKNYHKLLFITLVHSLCIQQVRDSTVIKLPQTNIPNVVLNVGLCTRYPYIIAKVRLGPCCQYPLHNMEMTPEWGTHQSWDIVLQWGIIRQSNFTLTLAVSEQLHQALQNKTFRNFSTPHVLPPASFWRLLSLPNGITIKKACGNHVMVH